MKIELDVLRAAISQLLDHAEQAHGKTVDLPVDLYWFVQKGQLNEPETVPTDLTLGSLADDWAEVAAIANGEKEPIGYALVWASSVIRAVGDRTP